MRTSVLFCLVLLVGTASATDSLFVRVIGTYDAALYAMGVAVQPDRVYVANTDDFRVLSAADPAHPVEVGRCNTPAVARGVDVAGGFVYVADCDTEPMSALRVISIADPANPIEFGICNMPDKPYDVAFSEGYACVADADAGLRVISVADPAHPVEVGHCDFPGAYHVKVEGDYAYVAAPGGAGLGIISIVDPTHPVEVGYYTPGYSKCVAVSGGYAYVGCRDNSFRVLSVADPTHPVEVGRLDSVFSWAEDLAFVRGHVFVASQHGGLKVFEVADPAHPAEVGRYGSQCWSIAVDRNYMYVGTSVGLLILQFYQLGDLDVDNDSFDVVADTMRLHQSGGTGVATGQFVLTNTSAAYNPDTVDGPSVSPVESLRCTGLLTGPGGTIDSIIIPNLPASLAQGQTIVCTLAVYVPPGMRAGNYVGTITITGRDTAGLLVDEEFYAHVRQKLGDLDVDPDSLDVVADTVRVLPWVISSRPPPEYSGCAFGEFILANTSASYNPDIADGPSLSPVDSLRFTGSFTGPGGTLDSVLIENLPTALAQGQTFACTLAVYVPPGLRSGDYAGPITITGKDTAGLLVAETVYALVTKLGDLDIDNDSLSVVRDTIDFHAQPAGPVYSPYAKAEFMLVNTSSSYNPDTADGPGCSLLRSVKAVVGSGTQGASIDSVYVLYVPESLAVGQSAVCTLALVIPVGEPLGSYDGRVTVSAYDTFGYAVRDSFFLTVRGPQPRQNLDSLRVGPIPFKPNQNPEHDAIHFQGLSSGARAIVYDASGQSVWSATENGDGHLEWDAKVASGIYVYLVVSADGKASKVGKLSVIR